MNEQPSVTFTQPNSMISNSVVTGGTFTNINQGIPLPRDILKILQDISSPTAFHSSGERYDPPKCHENTRVAVLQKIMDWIVGCDPETRDKWIMWLHGVAGAGKSAICQTLAERCDAEGPGRLLASFFFGRSDGTRNHSKSFTPTIVCQIYANIPGARSDIAYVINNDPLIFNKTLLIQLMTLVVEPLKRLGDTDSQHFIIIDGLDECVDRASQMTILRTLFHAVHKHGCRIRFLVASRPEHEILNAFSSRNVETILARLALDDGYQSQEDIKCFFRDKISEIASTHPFRKFISKDWPGTGVVDQIVKKSSGQFIYVSTVVTYIESARHRPDHRLETVRNLRPLQRDSDMPFAELDALYTHIFSSVKDTSMIEELLSFSIHETQYKSKIHQYSFVTAIEEIHNLEPGSLQLVLCDVTALVVIESFKHGDTIKVSHASLLDFLIDPSRSKDLHISLDLLMARHITNCLLYLSKDSVNDITTKVAVGFLANYCPRVSFTEDIARALNDFSLLKLCQHDKLSLQVKHRFLREANPALLELILRSDQYQLLSRYLNMVDESYVALLDSYPPEFLALQVTILMHENVFPRKAPSISFQFPPFHTQDDTLAILVPDGPDLLALMIENREFSSSKTFERHRAAFRQFILDPVRSRHHNFPSSSGKIYVKSLLGCFDYLSRLIFRYHCSKDGFWLIPFTRANRIMNQNAFSNEEIHWDVTGNRCPIPEEHRIAKEGVRRYLPYINPDRAETILGYPDIIKLKPLDEDIQSWYHSWHQSVQFNEDENWWPGFGMLSNDLPNGHVSMRKVLRGRYGLMLGYMIYFFPKAGKSVKLMELCKSTVLRKDITLFPVETLSAQRAVDAYVKRVEALEGDNE